MKERFIFTYLKISLSQSQHWLIYTLFLCLQSINSLILLILSQSISNCNIMRHNQHNIDYIPITTADQIYSQLTTLNLQNQQLIRLAQTIQTNSVMRHTHPTPIIASIEEQLRQGLTIIVQGINQLYKDIDRRLKIISLSLQQFNCGPFNLANQYQPLLDRITSLEQILRNSQQNEAKLLQIIQKLQSKDEDQSKRDIGIKQLESKVYRGFGRLSFEQSSVKSNASESSFRLFALNQPIQNISKEAVKVDKPIAKISPFTCMGVMPNGSVSVSGSEKTRVDIGGVSSQLSERSNHNHRLNFMMNTLGG